MPPTGVFSRKPHFFQPHATVSKKLAYLAEDVYSVHLFISLVLSWLADCSAQPNEGVCHLETFHLFTFIYKAAVQNFCLDDSWNIG